MAQKNLGWNTLIWDNVRLKASESACN